MNAQRHAIFLSGPVGVGKTTLGRGLAQRLGGHFLDGDDFSSPGKPWYCSIYSASKAIVREGLRALDLRSTLVIAYPLGCANWIYYRRRFSDAGVRPHFISLRASYTAIVSSERGRTFSNEECQRIGVMIEEGYGERRFSDEIFDTDQMGFVGTLDLLEQRIRERMNV